MDLSFEIPKPNGSPAHLSEHLSRTDAVKHAFKKEGWVKFNLSDADFAPWLWGDFLKFAEDAIRDLPDDVYDKTGLRKRVFAVFIYIPDQGKLVPLARTFDRLNMPKTPYFQPSAYQPEEGNRVRRFDAPRENQLNSPVVKALIDADYMIASGSGVLPEAAAYFVGFHIIKLQPRDHLLATVSPNAIHRDGEPLTFCHLLGRRNIRGGRNLVTAADCANLQPSDIDPASIMAEFELFETGESYVVDDRRVAHHVDGVGRLDPLQDGHRTVALIDFCPARRGRSDDLDAMTPADWIDLRQ